MSPFTPDDVRPFADARGRRGLRRRDVLRLALVGASGATVAAVLAACGGASPTATSAPATAAAAAPTSAPTAAASGQATSAPAAATAAPTATTAAAAQPTVAAAASPAGSPAATGQYPYPGGGKYSTIEPIGKKGGRIIEISSSEAITENPMLSHDTSSGAHIALQFNSLVDVNPDTGLPFPDLATEVPTQQNGGISADGLTYTFKLRPGIKWSDGQPLTAKDVVFTYTVMTDPKLASPRSGELTERVASVSAADDLTAVFKMKKVVAPFLVTDMFPICPEHILGSVPPDQIKSHPFSTGDPKATVGTGPFKFKEWVKDDHATFEKNPLYFRGEPALDEYVFKVVKDQGVVAAQLKTGEADYGGITPSLVADMSKQANLNVVNYNTYSWSFYAYQMNPQKSPFFLDKRVRQALAYALDREAMLKAIYFGFGEVAQGTIPDSSWAYAPDQITTKYTFDLTKANQLLDAAGWAKGADGIRAKDGKRFSFTLWTGVASQVYQQLCTAAQQMWKAVGVEATVKPEEWNAFISRISDARDFDIFLEGFSWGVDPDQTIMFRTGANLNRNPYSNPDVDKLLDQGLSELDQAKRKQIYIQMENILWDDLPSLPIADTQALAGLNKRVHNFFPNATNIRWNAHTWWVADGK